MRRFIAGAVCPRCGLMDKLQVDTERNLRECVSCGYSDERPVDGAPELRTRVNLSAELPASWTGDRLAIEYLAKIHADIPWWPDKRVAFVIALARPPAERPERSMGQTRTRPTVFVSHAVQLN